MEPVSIITDEDMSDMQLIGSQQRQSATSPFCWERSSDYELVLSVMTSHFLVQHKSQVYFTLFDLPLLFRGYRCTYWLCHIQTYHNYKAHTDVCTIQHIDTYTLTCTQVMPKGINPALLNLTQLQGNQPTIFLCRMLCSFCSTMNASILQI